MEIYWSLLFYSLLLGIAIGPFTVMAITDCFKGQEELCRWGSALGLGSLLLAGVAAFTHLGAPGNVTYLFTNLDSAMSQEMFVTGITGLIAALFAAQMFFGLWPKARRIVAWLGLIGTLISVLLIGRMYMLPARPMWNTWLLPFTFLTSSAAIGLVAMLLLAAGIPAPDAEERKVIVKRLSSWTFVAVLANAAIMLLYVGIATIQAGEFSRLLAGDLALSFWLGLVLLGVLGPIAFTWLVNQGEPKLSKVTTYMAVALILVLSSGIVLRALIFVLGKRVNLLS